MADLGVDISCVDDLSPSMAEVTGRTLLAQAIARRYMTPRGRLIDDLNYGFDLTQFVNDDLSLADIARIQAGAQAEAEKDERVESASVTINVSAVGLMVVTVVMVDSNGPFTLVLSVNSVSVQLLKAA